MQIVPYRPEYRGAFQALVREWVEQLFRVEAADEAVLDDPEGKLLRPGGFLFFARRGDALVGVCGLARREPDTYELVKLSVTASERGAGIGTWLSRFAVARARRAGARRVVLETNSRLDAANRVYASLGFREAPELLTDEYARADLALALELANGAQSAAPARVVGLDRLPDCHAVREQVFVQEQGVPPETDFDAEDPWCTQLLVSDAAGAPLGTARLRDRGRAAKVERVAVLAAQRGSGLGRALMQTLEAEARDSGYAELVLNAQADQVGFYEHLGYTAEGDEFFEADIPHRAMRKHLGRATAPVRKGAGREAEAGGPP